VAFDQLGLKRLEIGRVGRLDLRALDQEEPLVRFDDLAGLPRLQRPQRVTGRLPAVHQRIAPDPAPVAAVFGVDAFRRGSGHVLERLAAADAPVGVLDLRSRRLPRRRLLGPRRVGRGRVEMVQKAYLDQPHPPALRPRPVVLHSLEQRHQLRPGGLLHSRHDVQVKVTLHRKLPADLLALVVQRALLLVEEFFVFVLGAVAGRRDAAAQFGADERFERVALRLAHAQRRLAIQDGVHHPAAHRLDGDIRHVAAVFVGRHRLAPLAQLGPQRVDHVINGNRVAVDDQPTGRIGPAAADGRRLDRARSPRRVPFLVLPAGRRVADTGDAAG